MNKTKAKGKSMRLFVLLSLAMLAGCASNPEVKEVVVTKVEVIVKTPPDSLLRDCPVAAPPSPQDYAKKSFKVKEAMLVEFGAKQTVNIGNCNKDKAALRQWKTQQTQGLESSKESGK